MAIGASTGGTEAIAHLMSTLTQTMPAILIMRHMPAAFADRLNKLSPIDMKLAVDGQLLERGHAYLAPGGFHLSLKLTNGFYRLHVVQGPPVNGHCPSINVLFQSLAETIGSAATGILLTGKGADGAEGLVAMRKANALTIVQDESTSVVYGMPREATLRGGAEFVKPLQDISRFVREQFG